MDGGTGNDRLRGSGADTYRFGYGSGQDDIAEQQGVSGEMDRVELGVGIESGQLWFSQTGSDLAVSIIGTSDSLLVKNWYSGDIYHIEQFVTSDGSVLLDTQVQQLVDAMASFSPPAVGDLTLDADRQLALDPVIASSWQSVG